MLQRKLWEGWYVYSIMCVGGYTRTFTGDFFDSEYVRESKKLEQSDIFARQDTAVVAGVVSFINVFDKGCRGYFRLSQQWKTALLANCFY